MCILRILQLEPKGKSRFTVGCQYGHAFCDLGLNLISLQCWPYVFWKNVHHQVYLEEMICWAGQVDFLGSKDCPDCILWQKPTSGSPQYRCQECFLPNLTCQLCCVKHHCAHPLHCIEVHCIPFILSESH